MNIQSFAPLVRLREILKQQEWILGSGQGQQEEEEDGGLDHEAEKKMESLIMSLEVFCFKRNLTAKEFFDSIYEMYIAAQSLDIPLEEFPYYVQGLGAKIETLTKDNRIMKKELEESKVRDQKLTQQLLKVGKERRKYKIDLARERGRAVDLWWVEEQELEKINEDFGYGSDMVINPSNLGDALIGCILSSEQIWRYNLQVDGKEHATFKVIPAVAEPEKMTIAISYSHLFYL